MICESGLKYPLQISFIEDCVVPPKMVHSIVDPVEDWIFEEDSQKMNDFLKHPTISHKDGNNHSDKN